MFKAGFVNIIGNPNVGKSTLMNSLVGENLAITTNKVQTTRHRIMGIVSSEDFQIVYSDTPGILNPKYKLHDAMKKVIDGAFEDADILLYVTEVNEKISVEPTVLTKLQTMEIPIILVINKVDLSQQDKVVKLINDWKAIFPKAEIIPVSAMHKFNIESVFKKILEYLPENEAYFDKEAMTDRSERFFVSEIIREKILLYYQKEIPYSVEVVIDSFKDEATIARIYATIFVERDSQKGIIIGEGGKAIKHIGIEARKDIEKFLDKHVFIELSVKVRKDWRNEPEQLKRFGYTQ